ncbi:MAG: flagellar biosynthesis anti-sigma factor FlgM [Nitrospirae bacterium]|nr:flagellar biosynthesis anti-sigma factor FlgM [Nitrospirota bacterium]MBF0541188.1 flagellar biosynthesis anti-sigma factor FlgM [Nitrospirota bacterium]
MEINSTRPPGSQGTTTPGNVKKNDTQNADASKQGNAATADDVGASTSKAASKTSKKDLNAGNDVKVHNPQLDLDVHYSIARSGSSDRVTISTKAKDINAIKSAIAKLPDIRDDKVSKYKQAIDDDEYEPDSNAVAGRMLDEI